MNVNEVKGFVPNVIIPGAPVCIVGECPGTQELEQGQPFVGPSGKLLRKTLADLGVDRFSIVNAVPVYHPSGEPPTAEEIKQWNSYLWECIQKANPNIVIGVGGVALRALYEAQNINDWSGQIVAHQGFKIGFTIHPALILRVPEYIIQFRLHLEKFVKESHTKDLVYDPDPLFNVISFNDLPDVAEILHKAPIKSVDCETTGFDPLTSRIICIGFCIGDQSYILYTDALDPQYLVRWLDYVMSNGMNVFYNAKFDMKFFYRLGCVTIRNFQDVMYILRFIEEDLNPLGPPSLKLAVRTFLNRPNFEAEVHKYAPKKSDSYESVPRELLSRYLAEDVHCTYRLFQMFYTRLSTSQVQLMNKLLRFTNIQCDAELKGVRINLELLEKLKNEMKADLDKIQRDIFNYTGEFNINSTAQLSQRLQSLGIKLSKKTRTGKYSTNSEVLDSLKGAHPVIDHLIQYRKLMKLYSTFIEGLDHKNGKVYPDINLVGAPTGRTSCRGTNVQQIPREPVQIRNLFIPDENHLWIECDYERAELYMMAYYSGDTDLLNYLNTTDVHTEVAKQLGIMTNGEVTKEDRMLAKAIVFGLCYGASAAGLSESTGIPRKVLEPLVERFFKRFPRVKQWMDMQRELARQGKPFEYFSGRIRHIPKIGMNGPDFLRAIADLERKMINSPIQGTVADVVLASALRVVERFEYEGVRGRYVFLIHDAVYFSVHKEDVLKAVKIIKQEMERPFYRDHWIPVEIKVGRCWGDPASVTYGGG
jgi:DNA polymerase-1